MGVVLGKAKKAAPQIFTAGTLPEPPLLFSSLFKDPYYLSFKPQLPISAKWKDVLPQY